MTIVSIILDVLFLIVVALIMITCVKDLIDSHRWNKKMNDEYEKLISDTKRAVEITKLKMAIQDANLNIYETPSGKYILIPKEDK